MDRRLLAASLTSVTVMATVVVTLFAQRPPAPVSGPAHTTARIVASAQTVLKTLDDTARAKVQFTFDSPQKTNWSNLPSGIYKRNSLRVGDLQPAQRTAVMKLLETALSADGFRKVVDVMHGDEVLKRAGRAGAPPFGEDEFYLAFLGTPSTTTPWMLQFGGHHLAINLTIVGSQTSMAPSLPAAQPATFEWEGRTVRPLRRRERQGLRAHQRPRREAEGPGHSQLSRSRPRARAVERRQDDPA